MKFDMTAAWSEAMRLLSANRQVVGVVAGVFFFLPWVAFSLLFASQTASLQAAGTDVDSAAMSRAMLAAYSDNWWALLLLAVAQGIGMLGLLTLLTDRSRPTVGDALATGAKLFLPYMGAQLLISVVCGLLLLIAIAVAAAISPAAGVALGLVAAIACVYIFIKCLLTPAVIAIERQANPIAALTRSWQLTKGNSLRVFLFVFLLMVAVGLVGGVIGLIAGLIFALGGADAKTIGDAIVSGLVNAVFYTIFLAVLAAIYRQLAGSSHGAVRETFE